MMSAVVARAVAIGAALALGVGGCTTLLGLDEEYTHAGGAGGEATSTSSGSVDGGGLGGGTTSGTTSGTTTSGTTGAGGGDGQGGGAPCIVAHLGGGTCEYLPGLECGCAASERCTVVNETLGESGCVSVEAGAAPAWSACASDAACGIGTFCDHETGACKPMCSSSVECPQGAACVAAKSADGHMIPGLALCTAHCNPETGAPCGAGLACDFSDDFGSAELDCHASGGLGPTAACQGPHDCANGLVCVDDGTKKTCLGWCHPVDESAPNFDCFSKSGGIICTGLSQTVLQDGTTYGVCTGP
jgi:hypothetical protein